MAHYQTKAQSGKKRREKGGQSVAWYLEDRPCDRRVAGLNPSPGRAVVCKANTRKISVPVALQSAHSDICYV